MSVITNLKDDLAKFLDSHSSEIQDALGVAEQVASSPLAQAALGLVHVPPTAVQAMADMLARFDEEFGKLVPPAAAPAEVPSPAPAEAAPPAPPASIPAPTNVMP